MLVVADSSPIIVLTKINRLELLPTLFERVVVPPAITNELRAANRPPLVRELARARPLWLIEQTPTTLEEIPKLDAGERAAISLARELNANFLLIDEAKGRSAATARNLKVVGTVGILETAARASLIDLSEAFEAIKRTDFWIPHPFLDRRLDLFRSQRGNEDSP